ncbi:D-lactate dehydrogenase [Gulosibacter chungangensis]|uniref:Quinone-dependent D-lactate dehydrogenase n=2 Tax=Gulosibacter chungangensis TaxID=979746 RepID=A0A7J5BGF7_9MICO|nr:D-lactate dehydrogenase [Gulosibacter chungangensis]KAB1645357.1 D-lactate dehydrogenase [Gulosibacter chungangensis]
MHSNEFRGTGATLKALVDILGKAHVLTSARATGPYARGNRFGSGKVLAVLRPGNLVDMWRALQVCVDKDLIVIPQAANTGLTGGSGPGQQGYDRDVVIMSTMRINQIHLINDAREAVCLAGSRLYELEDTLAPHGREPHSVIGSTSIGASVIGGIANNSGGSQVRKGPAFTEHAIFARVNEDKKVELVNHLGIELGDDPAQVLDRLQRGDWSDADVTPPPTDSLNMPYAEHVREIADSPARYNADPKFLYEASGSAGKILVFAVRTRTFPKDEHTTTFYIGTNDPAELEDLRRAVLASDNQLPISGEYLDRTTFDLAEKYGKDTYVAMKYAGSNLLGKMFSLKTWANGVFGKFKVFGPTFADTISQKIFGLVPAKLPKRLVDIRDRYEHHLIMEVGNAQKQETEQFLTAFFAEPGRGGGFLLCTEDEAESAMLQRFGAASAMGRYNNLNREKVGGMVTFDVALRRDDYDWLEVLPPEIKDQIEVSVYYGHFFCHVMHQNHVAKKGVDTAKLKEQMTKLLTDRGAAIPAEHNYGRIYEAPESLESFYKELDPCNVFNAGVGNTSPRRNWA